MVLEGEFDGVVWCSLNHLVAEDIAFLAEDLGNCDLHLGRRDLNNLLSGHIGVADSGEIICNWISHILFFLIFTNLPSLHPG